MLAGRRAFRGETEVDTMTAVLLENPPEIDLEQVQRPRISLANRAPLSGERTGESFSIGARLGVCSGHSVKPFRRRKNAAQGFAEPSERYPMGAGGSRFWLRRCCFWQISGARPTSPTYRRLTFEQGTVYSARFAPDFRAIVYGAAWNDKPLQIFSTVGDSLLAQPLNLSDANLLAISRTGELAVALHGAHMAHLETVGGTLARAPLAGGSPREVLEDVPWADWDANGELLWSTMLKDCDRIEYPIGHVLYQSKGWISHLRFSPQADKIAFMDHPAPVG